MVYFVFKISIIVLFLRMTLQKYKNKIENEIKYGVLCIESTYKKCLREE